MVPGESAGFCVSGPRDIGPVCILCLPNVGQGEGRRVPQALHLFLIWLQV